MTERSMVEAIREALHQEMERDDRVVVYGEDVAVNGGVFRATDGLLERRPGLTPLARPGQDATTVRRV